MKKIILISSLFFSLTASAGFEIVCDFSQSYNAVTRASGELNKKISKISEKLDIKSVSAPSISNPDRNQVMVCVTVETKSKSN